MLKQLDEQNARQNTREQLSAPPIEPHPGLSPREVLVAASGIQFIDIAIGEARAAGISQRYFECTATSDSAEGPSLHQIDLEDDGTFRHPVTDAATEPSETYAVDGRKALDAFAGAWIPLPFMRVVGAASSAPEYTEGPANWARLFVHRDASSQGEVAYRLVLAIDTAIASPAADDAAYLAPSVHDLAEDTEFAFSADVEAVGWFVTEPWVDEWLSHVFRANRTRMQALSAGSELHEQRALPHLAHYLTLLQTLADAALVPTLQLTAAGPGDQDTVPVDLLLDLGASRMYAALAECRGASVDDIAFDPLPIRDLTAPHVTHKGVMASRLEFARADFGSEVFSRWSGRTNAFYWPSVVRIGAEAARLEGEPRPGDTVTGISSPIRYLWDDRPSRQLWRFSGAPGAPRRHGVVSDPLLAFLTETGAVLADGASPSLTTKPRFSRSSLATHYATELILHALSAINAPAHRWNRNRDGEPRRLSRILLTTPASMQPAEREILQQRVENAVVLLWRALGWDKAAAGLARRPPQVTLATDTAGSAALAFLHNELGHKFRGDAPAYFNLVGKARQGAAAGRSLRIATLDVGGSSSSLSISHFALPDSQTLAATSHLRDGFPAGGENALKKLIEAIVLPAIERRLADCKLPDAPGFLRAMVAEETSGRTPRLVEFRRRFAAAIARPAAIAIVRELELLRSTSEDRPIVRTIGSLLAAVDANSGFALDELDSLATDAGADGFTSADTPITFTIFEVSATISGVLEGVVASAVRVIRSLDCDIVLLTGWLSRLPVLKEMLLAGMPLRPDRILAMHEYRVAPWLPHRSALGNVDDSKSLACAGAWLPSTAAPRVGGLSLVLSHADLSAGHCYIGRIDRNGHIAADACVFSSSTRARVAAGQQATLVTDLPAILAMRRAPLASWPALPMYAIALEPAASEDPPRMPVRITLSWNGELSGRGTAPAIVRATDADGMDLAENEISIRLQTMTTPDGDWLDTGAFCIE